MINQGLHRIFVEILSNAIDNVWRSLDSSTPCTSIKVDINRETGEISIWNNGKTIPIEINPETRLYNPEMLFGRLLSGSNFNDNEERKSSGTNGLGSVVCNIFSTAFEVDVFDNHTLKKYVQTWTKNMGDVGKPKITTPKTKAGYVKITFSPDFERFGCTGLSDDMYSLFYKNVVDTAMLTGVNVFFNGTKIPMKTLKDYASLYVSPIASIAQPEAVEAIETVEEKEDSMKTTPFQSPRRHLKKTRRKLAKNNWIKSISSVTTANASCNPTQTSPTAFKPFLSSTASKHETEALMSTPTPKPSFAPCWKR